MEILVLNWQDRLNPLGGGAETHLHEIFGRLAARGHAVTLLTSGWPGSAPRETVDGMDVHRTGRRYTFNVVAPRYYRRHLRGRAFDVVVEDLNKVPVYTPLWVRRPLVLLVHHLFGLVAFQEVAPYIAAPTWLLEQPLPWIYRGVPVEAVSQSTADDLRRRGFRSEIEIIPNGVDTRFFRPGTGERFETPTLLYMGRLKRYKRVDLIIRALARLRDSGHAGIRLVVGGRGDYDASLHALARRLGVDDAVDFAGYVSEDEKLRLLQRSWVHLLTSPKEGWGISNLEAAACGTPSVASDSPGLRDSVADGRTGFLVPHGDVAAIADRVRAIVEDPALRERLGTQAREFAERHSWEHAADLTERHLEHVAGSERVRRA